MTITFCSPFVSYYATYHFKNILKVDHVLKVAKIWAISGLNYSVAQKGFFMKN